MSDKIKRALAALALGALALGGAAIANAAAGEDSGDGDGTVSAAIDRQARAAAEQATGGVANGDVEPAEPADPPGPSAPPSW